MSLPWKSRPHRGAASRRARVRLVAQRCQAAASKPSQRVGGGRRGAAIPARRRPPSTRLRSAACRCRTSDRAAHQPSAYSCGHPPRSSTAAARFSFSGASPCALAPAATMQRSAAEVDRQDRPALAHDEVQAQVGRFDVDVRPRSGPRPHDVDDGILDALRRIARMRDRIARDMRVDGHGVAADPDARARPRPRRPRTRHVRRRNRIRRSATARGWPGATTTPRAAHRRACLPHSHLRRCGRASAAQREQFVGQQVFQALAATGEEFHWRERTTARRTPRRWPRRAPTGDGCRRRAAGCAAGSRPGDDIGSGDQFVVPAVDDGCRHPGGIQRVRGVQHDRRRHQEQARDRHLQRHMARDPGTQAGTCEHERGLRAPHRAPCPAGARRARRRRRGRCLAHGVEVGEIRAFAASSRGVRQRASAVTLVASGPLSKPWRGCSGRARLMRRPRRRGRHDRIVPPSTMRAHRPPMPRIAL